MISKVQCWWIKCHSSLVHCPFKFKSGGLDNHIEDLTQLFSIKIKKHHLPKVTQHYKFIRPLILTKVNVTLRRKLKSTVI